MRLRFDALDAVDVEEVVLVVVGDVALHLRRAHAAVRLRDVDHRQIEMGKIPPGMRLTAKTAVSATAITATRTVRGRTTEGGADQPHGSRTPAETG